MANLYIKTGGAWASIKSSSSVKNGGAWAALKGAWVRDAGTWKQAWVSSSATATLPSSIYCSALIDKYRRGLAFGSSAWWRTASNGATSVPTWESAGATWLTSGSASECQIRMTPSTGSEPVFDTANGSLTSGVWYTLGTDRHWWVAGPGGSDGIWQGTVEIRRIADSIVLATSSVDIRTTY